MESLFKIIISYHGKDTMENAKLFEKFHILRAKLISNLTYLKHCRDENIIPRFARINHPLKHDHNLTYLKHCRDENIIPRFARINHPLKHDHNIPSFNRINEIIIKK